MASQATTFLTPEQYLERDSRAEHPSEYYDGVMYPVEATSFRHSDIQLNLAGFVRQALRNSPCKALGPTVRVRLPNQRYSYPDLFVVCGAIEREDKTDDTALNPTVIFEVLSPSTGDFDRGGKSKMYRAIPSLREYVVIAQDRVSVERFTRQGDRKWLLEEITDVNATLSLESIGIEIPMSEIYAKVELDRVAD